MTSRAASHLRRVKSSRVPPAVGGAHVRLFVVLSVRQRAEAGAAESSNHIFG